MNRLLIVKSAVFLLTFLIIFGMLLLAAKIYQNAKFRKFSDINLNQPDGSTIRQITNDDKNLYILVSGGQKPERIIIFNSEQNKVISNLILN